MVLGKQGHSTAGCPEASGVFIRKGRELLESQAAHKTRLPSHEAGQRKIKQSEITGHLTVTPPTKSCVTVKRVLPQRLDMMLVTIGHFKTKDDIIEPNTTPHTHTPPIADNLSLTPSSFGAGGVWVGVVRGSVIVHTYRRASRFWFKLQGAQDSRDLRTCPCKGLSKNRFSRISMKNPSGT